MRIKINPGKKIAGRFGVALGAGEWDGLTLSDGDVIEVADTNGKGFIAMEYAVETTEPIRISIPAGGL